MTYSMLRFLLVFSFCRGSSHVEGVAAEVHPEHVQKEIKGKTIK
jgi:hypothetical protein